MPFSDIAKFAEIPDTFSTFFSCRKYSEKILHFLRYQTIVKLRYRKKNLHFIRLSSFCTISFFLLSSREHLSHLTFSPPLIHILYGLISQRGEGGNTKVVLNFLPEYRGKRIVQKPKREIKCRFFAILQIYNFSILQKGQAFPLSFLYEKVLKISRILQYCTVCDITKNGHFSLFPLPFLC